MWFHAQLAQKILDGLLKGHILVNCSGSQISINETTKLFIPKIPNHEDISNVTLDLTHTKLSSLNRLKNIHGYDRLTGLYVSFNNLTEMIPTTVYSSFTEKATSNLPEKLTRLAFDHNQISYFDYEALKSQVQRYTYRVLQTIQMKLILLCVWAEPAVLGRAKTALKFKYEI